MASSTSVIAVDVEALEHLAGRLRTASCALVDDVGMFADGGNGIEHAGLRGTVDNFDERWSDKRHQIRDAMEKTADAFTTAADSFASADQELAACVAGEGGGQ